MLWRIDGLTESPYGTPQKLRDGLRLHLQHAPLTSVLVTIGTAQRAYVELPSCAGCLHGRCVTGCPTALFRRLLRSWAVTVTLQPVAKGLATRHYAQVCLAWPTPAAQPITADWANAWEESRIQIRYAAGRTPRAAILVAVGAGNATLAQELHAVGWFPIPVPRVIAPWLLTPQPWPVWFPRRLPGEPVLLLPGDHEHEAEIACDLSTLLPAHDVVDRAPIEQEAPSPALPPATDATEELSSRVLADLRAVLAGEQPFRRIPLAAPQTTQIAEVDIIDSDPSPFPAGPGTGKSAMLPNDVEAWVAGMLAHPQGYTRKTIAALLGEPHKEHATVLLLWLEQAQLLGAASDSTQPYRYPRALMLHDDALIADRLRTTPLPDAAALKAAKSRGL